MVRKIIYIEKKSVIEVTTLQSHIVIKLRTKFFFISRSIIFEFFDN